MSIERMGVLLEVWGVAADRHGLWLVSGHGDDVGADAWRPGMHLGADEDVHHSVELVLAQFARRKPEVIHSSSWRQDPDGGGLILTYMTVFRPVGRVLSSWPTAHPITADLAALVDKPWAHGPVDKPLPRWFDVLWHGIGHLRWLNEHNSTVHEALPGYWQAPLAEFTPTIAGMYLKGQGLAYLAASSEPVDDAKAA